jgi:hypothetical protein
MRGFSFLSSSSKSMGTSKLKEWENAFHLPSNLLKSCPRMGLPTLRLSERRMSREREKERSTQRLPSFLLSLLVSTNSLRDSLSENDSLRLIHQLILYLTISIPFDDALKVKTISLIRI